MSAKKNNLLPVLILKDDCGSVNLSVHPDAATLFYRDEQLHEYAARQDLHQGTAMAVHSDTFKSLNTQHHVGNRTNTNHNLAAHTGEYITLYNVLKTQYCLFLFSLLSKTTSLTVLQMNSSQCLDSNPKTRRAQNPPIQPAKPLAPSWELCPSPYCLHCHKM